MSTNYIDIQFGRIIKALRIINGMTQTNLADKLDITFQQVQKYESGVNRISACRLYYIAEALSIKPGYFYDRIKKISPDNEEEESNVLCEKEDNINLLVNDRASNETVNLQDCNEIVKLVKHYKLISDKKVRTNILQLIENIADNYCAKNEDKKDE